jgi:hypothetical protein
MRIVTGLMRIDLAAQKCKRVVHVTFFNVQIVDIEKLTREKRTDALIVSP